MLILFLLLFDERSATQGPSNDPISGTGEIVLLNCCQLTLFYMIMVNNE